MTNIISQLTINLALEDDGRRTFFVDTNILDSNDKPVRVTSAKFGYLYDFPDQEILMQAIDDVSVELHRIAEDRRRARLKAQRKVVVI